MADIKNIQNRYGGYLLLESLIALGLVGVLILITLPAFVAFQRQMQERNHRLEVYRFAYELAKEEQGRRSVSTVQKHSLGIELTGNIVKKNGMIQELTVNSEEENLVFELISKP